MNNDNDCIAIKNGIKCNSENIKQCKGYIIKTGDPCLNKVKDNGNFCGIHNKHKLLYSEKKLLDNIEEKKEELHEKPVVFLELGLSYKIMINNNKNVIIEEDKNIAYFEKDLNKQFKNNTILDNKNLKLTETPTLLKYKLSNKERKFRYFIIILYNNIEIVFIPAFNKKLRMFGLGQVLYEDFLKKVIVNNNFNYQNML